MTNKGLYCQKWNQRIPNKVFHFPQDRKNHAYCRAPKTGPSTKPWCYTTSRQKDRVDIMLRVYYIRVFFENLSHFTAEALFRLLHFFFKTCHSIVTFFQIVTFFRNVTFNCHIFSDCFIFLKCATQLSHFLK